ncbi:hypothetical protein [Usitatibacter palustris]|uniref:hypothetical protein n=1 Tax=Usitatibacter palustris TaxID=2732487 RepID=UPI001488D003|nr:hypothetical protein [Usitatibacter palustris]
MKHLSIEHRAVLMMVSVGIAVVVLAVSLLRAKDNPAFKLKPFWKVAAAVSLLMAAYVWATNDI